jgi:hypothetical protein
MCIVGVHCKCAEPDTTFKQVSGPLCAMHSLAQFYMHSVTHRPMCTRFTDAHGCYVSSPL